MVVDTDLWDDGGYIPTGLMWWYRPKGWWWYRPVGWDDGGATDLRDDGGTDPQV